MTKSGVTDTFMADPKKDQKKPRTGLYAFIGITTCLVALAVYLLLTYKPKYVAKEFYEDRQAMDIYQEYMKKENAKKSNKEKSERNIFLQD